MLRMLPKGFLVRGAAYELYAAEGPEGLSMRKLGKRIGTSAAAIYKHVESRVELLENVAETAFVSMSSCLLRHSR
jgi:AcrR family transcriptional regulator